MLLSVCLVAIASISVHPGLLIMLSLNFTECMRFAGVNTAPFNISLQHYTHAQSQLQHLRIPLPRL
jgi:hypothetical protein